MEEAQILLDAVAQMKSVGELFEEPKIKAKYFLQSFGVEHSEGWKIVLQESSEPEVISNESYLFITLLDSTDSANTIYYYIFTCN